MDTIDRLIALLPADAARCLALHRKDATEIRLRANRPAQLVWSGGESLIGQIIEAHRLREIVSALMDYSLYAHEAELAQGFFTMNDGCRVGVCGRFAAGGGNRLTNIGSACVRVARAMPGCADQLMSVIDTPEGTLSTLLIAPPGMGKTTLLRDIARQLSERGCCVGIADERHELAACQMGTPTLDVGARTDVLDGCPRPQALRQLIRSMSPDVVVADELGGKDDGSALSEAARCGVAVVASAHAGSLVDARRRPALREILEGGTLRLLVLLGGAPGRVLEVHRLDGGGDAHWKSA